MTADGPVEIDTRDMVGLHSAFTRALGDAPGQAATVSDGDVERARRLADYLAEVLWLIHAHHEGEDELLYPLLVQRVGEQSELFSKMDAQHIAVKAGVDAAKRAAARFGATGSAADGQALGQACEELCETLADHLRDEEDAVLPIAARWLSPPEWGAMPAHALMHYAGTRVWLPFGLALEGMPDDVREGVLAHVPPPVAQMWFGGGSDAFANEMALIRGVA